MFAFVPLFCASFEHDVVKEQCNHLYRDFTQSTILIGFLAKWCIAVSQNSKTSKTNCEQNREASVDFMVPDNGF
jgi:hypothetical protein